MSGRWVLGVDVGGTNVVAGLVPVEGGAPAALRARGTASMGGPEGVVQHAARITCELLEEAGGAWADLLGVGIGCPGPLDIDAGLVLDAFNLGWRDVPLRDLFAETFELPASLDNDANCATYGEWWQGAGRGCRSLVGVTLGTGVGGGLVVDGRIVRGASGSAGEIGHMTIDLAGRRCGCGNDGCLEAYASGRNIAARAREGLRDGARSALLDLAEGDLERVTALLVSEAILLGDAYAREVMADAARILGVGVASLVNVLNPEAVVVVGGVTRAGEHLFVPLREEVRRRAFRGAAAACRIVPGELPETAGTIGAAGLFLAGREA